MMLLSELEILQACNNSGYELSQTPEAKFRISSKAIAKAQLIAAWDEITKDSTITPAGHMVICIDVNKLAEFEAEVNRIKSEAKG